MKKNRRKNQMVITALALMIAVAGYLNFSGKEMTLLDHSQKVESADASDTLETSGKVDSKQTADAGQSTDTKEMSDAKKKSDGKESVSVKDTADGEVSDAVDADEDMLTQNGDDSTISAKVDDSIDDTVTASSSKVANSVIKAQLAKEQSRSQNKEMLMEIINSENVTKAQKNEASSQLMQISDFMEKEASAEQVLAAKGYKDSMVSMSKDSVDVMVNLDNISDVDRAKIEDVVQRKTGMKMNNIVISSYK